MLTIQNLTFWYSKQNTIFENLELQLEAGHIYGLLGKNGAGKTTLLKLICGLSFPKSGIVDIDGHIPGKRGMEFLSAIFLVPEEISLPSLSPRTFAEINSDFYPAFDPAKFRECLQKFDVDREMNCSIMSRGQKNKTMIAFALACNTNYLFLDEPTNGLDIPSKAALRSMIASSFTEEKTIILSTHMVRELESLIDSVVILDNHSIILNNTLDEISQKLRFTRSPISVAPTELIYSAKSELGPVSVSKNSSGIPGNVDLEALFNACTSIPEIISSCINH